MTSGVFLTAIALFNGLLGFYVWHHRPSAAPNRSFAFLALTISAWTLGIALAYHSAIDISVSTKLTFAAASLMPLAVLCLFLTFPNEPRLHLDIASKLFAAAAVAFCAFSFTSLIVLTASRGPDDLHLGYGPLYPFYAVYVYACLAWSFATLVPRYTHATGLAKLQFRYFLLGLLLPGVGVTITNLLIPLFFDSSRFSQYGPYFGLVFLAFTAHALIRYRFMDIRLVIRRGATILLGLLASVASLSVALLIVSRVSNWAPSPPDIIFLILAGTIMGLSVPLLNNGFTRLLDKYFYRTRTDYQETLRNASEALSRILDFDSLTSFIVHTVRHVTRADLAALYLRAGDDFQLKCDEHYIDGSPSALPALIKGNSVTASFLSQCEGPLVMEEISRRSFPESPQILEELTQWGCAILVPISLDRHLLGIVAVGPRLSRDPFYPEDLIFLSTVAGQATTAITNADLYKQVLLANEYINNILGTMESGVIAASQEGNITLFNAAAERLIGLNKEVATSLTVTNLPPVLAEALTATIQDGHPRLQVEATVLDFRKRFISVVCSTSPLRDRRGLVLGAVLVFSDLTTLKHLETQKRHAERLASLGAIASGLAHEIKNPLVAIRTFAELLPERFTDEDFRDEFSRLVIAEIERIDELVAKLRGFASPSRDLQSPVDITEPIEDTLSLLRGHMEQKQITVNRLFETPSPIVTGDAAQLKQLFLNIFINAIQSMSINGELRICIKDRRIHSSQRLLIEIADTGTGIPRELLPTLFEPFGTTKALGSGLGLAICRNIVDAHNATITAANNTPNPGATISINFPMRKPGGWEISAERLTPLESPP